MHGVISSVLGHRDDGATDFAICPPQLGPEDTSIIEVRLLDDDRLFIDRFVDGVTKMAQSGGFRLGPRERRRHVAVLPARGPVSVGVMSMVEAQSWEQLHHAAAPVDSFTANFLTPYFARQGRTTLPFPMPGSITRSLERHWAAHAGPLASTARVGPLELAIAAFEGGTMSVTMDRRTWSGFVGEVSYTVVSGSSSERIALARLLASARFSGIGSSVAYGFGVVDITT